jgi:hypothetical protein
VTQQQPERRWSSGLAGYAPPTSDLKDAFAQAGIPTRWLTLTHDAQGRVALGPLRPPVALDARSLTHAQLIGVFADLIRRSLTPAFVLLAPSQRAALQLTLACPPIALVAASTPLLVDWLLLSRLVMHVIPRHQLWLGLDEPLVRVRDKDQSLVLMLDALMEGTPSPLVFKQIQRPERVVALVLADVRRLAQLTVNRREPPDELALRIMAALDSFDV